MPVLWWVFLFQYSSTIQFGHFVYKNVTLSGTHDLIYTNTLTNTDNFKNVLLKYTVAMSLLTRLLFRSSTRLLRPSILFPAKLFLPTIIPTKHIYTSSFLAQTHPSFEQHPHFGGYKGDEVATFSIPSYDLHRFESGPEREITICRAELLQIYDDMLTIRTMEEKLV